MFEIDPNIRYARTLSSEFYTDEQNFERAKEKIFARTWHLVGTTDERSNLKPFDLLGTPLLLSKNGKNISCFSNVCTHRGAILVENECQVNGIRCRYHGRRFDLNGKFVSMPEFDQVENFPDESENLPRIASEIWGKFIFASLDPIVELGKFLEEMQKTVLIPEDLRFAATKDYYVDAHWALYCENYLEGFHVPFVHGSLNEVIDYGTYQTRTFRFSSLQTAFSKEGELAAHYFFIFPNLMFNFYPWGLSINIVTPINPSRTKVTYWTFVSDGSKMNSGAGADLETVELEDQAIVESVQRGIRSRYYVSGRYSPTREEGTHHFHRLISEFME